MYKKLIEIGKMIDVDKEEIKNIVKTSISKFEKIKFVLLSFVIIVISSVLGFILGKSNPVYSKPPGFSTGYPFHRNNIVIPGGFLNKRKKWLGVFATFLLSILVFISVYKFPQIQSQPVFGVAIKYNVYRRQKTEHFRERYKGLQRENLNEKLSFRS